MIAEKLPFGFGIDRETGLYGYIKVGADTVTPFKTIGQLTRVTLGEQIRSFNESIIPYTDMWKFLSADNFITENSKSYGSSSWTGWDNVWPPYSSPEVKQYDPTTGILKWSVAYSYYKNGGWAGLNSSICDLVLIY